jgi:hypothetical protein
VAGTCFVAHAIEYNDLVSITPWSEVPFSALPRWAMPDTPHMENTTISVTERVMFGHSLSWWNEAMLVSLGVAAICALAVAFTTTVVVKMQAQAETDATEALERYKLDAEKNINDAKARAAKAELDLAKFKAPRILTPEQIIALTNQLKPLGKVAFDVATEQSHEPAALLAQICEALKDAGWDWQNWEGGALAFKLPKQDRVAGMASVSGVEIQIAESDRATLEKHAVALINALTSFGITTNARVYFDDASKALGHKKGLIHIIIGSKGPE